MKSLLALALLALAAAQYQYPSDTRNTNQWTTNYGAPVPNNDQSLTVGTRGPVLLEDYLLVEKLANFDRERIPERVVHAVGASARGYFVVTDDVSKLTMADFLQPGRSTPLITRFSTVIHSRGSPETLRDPRGFAVKFYTQQGNYDLVGNNFPVFFIRDAMKFPDMVHSLKPNPINNQQEWWRIWDFFTAHPESAHMFTFLLDDVGIPKDYRHMDGFGVHTFKWINSSGYEILVKYHWKTRQGVESLSTDSQVAAITNHAHAQADLYNSIMAGNFPIWDLKVQTMELSQVDSLDFDPLDVTKTWPENLFPLKNVGYMILNETISNFFHENEQLAFGPAIVVPGIYYSNDKLLQGRLFSYPDTQRYRLGGNYLMLPVNQPRCPYRVNMFEGESNFMKRTNPINYFPSRIDPATNGNPFPISRENLNATAMRVKIPKENNFAQAAARFQSFDAARKQRFIARVVDAFSDRTAIGQVVYNRWWNIWYNVDPSIAMALGPNPGSSSAAPTSTSSNTASAANNATSTPILTSARTSQPTSAPVESSASSLLPILATLFVAVLAIFS